jgi:hypothetical protein
MSIQYNHYINSINGDNDFGFGGSIEDVEVSQNDCLERLQKIENLILPLLNNLMLNPDNPIIKWPNRESIIKEKINELLALTRG